MRSAGAVSVALCLALAGCAGTTKGIFIPLPAPEVATKLVIAGLSSADPRVRAKSAWSLAGAKDMQAEAIAGLEPLQADPVKAVRYSAAWALGHIKGAVPSSGASEGNSPPKLVRVTRPNYPQDAFAKHVEGTVLVEVLIGEEGEVAHAMVRSSIKELDDAALACVREWNFEPSRVAGMPRATLAQAPITFRIY